MPGNNKVTSGPQGAIPQADINRGFLPSAVLT